MSQSACCLVGRDGVRVRALRGFRRLAVRLLADRPQDIRSGLETVQGGIDAWSVGGRSVAPLLNPATPALADMQLCNSGQAIRSHDTDTHKAQTRLFAVSKQSWIHSGQC